MEKRSSVLRIGRSKEVLNKHKKEFNRLTEIVEALLAEVAQLKSTFEKLRFRFSTEQFPQIREYQSLQIDLLYLLIRADSLGQINRSYKSKLTQVIAEISESVFTHERFVELYVLLREYLPEGFEFPQAAPNDPTPIADPKSILAQDAVSTLDFHLLSKEEQEHIKAESRRSKQMEREQSILEQGKTSASVRKVYAKLVKMFHPDLVTGEEEKLDRTKQMQKITDAYQKDNLMALLYIQFEMESGKIWQPELLGKEQLIHYNRVLREQIDDLKGEKETIQVQLAGITHLPPARIESATIAIMQFNTIKNELKAAIRELKQTVILLRAPGYANGFLGASR